MYKSVYKTYLILQRLHEPGNFILEFRRHRMNEFASIRMNDFESMITSVRDAFDANHTLHIINIASRNDCNVNIRHIAKPLQYIFRLQWKSREIGMCSDRCQSSIIIKKKRQFVVVTNIPGEHAPSLDRYPAFIMSQVATARAGRPPSKSIFFIFFQIFFSTNSS